jgi:hypothetical protein
VSYFVSVQLDALAGLSADLRVLGAELTEDQQLSSATGWSLERALAGAAGEEARQVGAAWAGVVAALAVRTQVVAATLDAALAAYRAADAGLAGQVEAAGAGRIGAQAVPR